MPTPTDDHREPPQRAPQSTSGDPEPTYTGSAWQHEASAAARRSAQERTQASALLQQAGGRSGDAALLAATRAQAHATLAIAELLGPIVEHLSRPVLLDLGGDRPAYPARQAAADAIEELARRAGRRQ